MKSNSGEVIIGLLIGLAIGIGVLAVSSDNKAQEIANKTGRQLSGLDVIAENPVDSAWTVAVPSLAGAGIGLVVDALKGGDSGSSRDNNVSVGGEDNNVSITISGDSDDDTSNDNDNDNDGSYNN